MLSGSRVHSNPATLRSWAAQGPWWAVPGVLTVVLTCKGSAPSSGFLRQGFLLKHWIGFVRKICLKGTAGDDPGGGLCQACAELVPVGFGADQGGRGALMVSPSACSTLREARKSQVDPHVFWMRCGGDMRTWEGNGKQRGRLTEG